MLTKRDPNFSLFLAVTYPAASSTACPSWCCIADNITRGST